MHSSADHGANEESISSLVAAVKGASTDEHCRSASRGTQLKSLIPRGLRRRLDLTPLSKFSDPCLARARRLRRVVFLDERRGMSRGVDLLQGADRHVRVNLRGLDVLVAEDLLDEADVGSVLVHVRRHAVAQ